MVESLPAGAGDAGSALVWEDPACRGVAGPVSHGCWACVSGACAPQQERLHHDEEWPPLAVAGGPSHRNEDPTQPKINK